MRQETAWRSGHSTLVSYKTLHVSQSGVVCISPIRRADQRGEHCEENAVRFYNVFTTSGKGGLHMTEALTVGVRCHMRYDYVVGSCSLPNRIDPKVCTADGDDEESTTSNL